MDNAATAVNSLLRKVVPGSENENQSQQEPQTNTIDSKKAGAKDTTVDEHVAPAVTKEHITKTHENEVQEVVDKERHQDHFHTTVQPLKDREVQPEVHDHKVAATREKNINNDDGSVARKVAGRENEFSSTTEEGKTKETRTQAETVEGEHVHHHLHETVQPVIEKEVIKPSVTHTTVPIHEVHKEKAVDHGITKKAPMSVEEFKARGNDPAKAVETHKEYAGAPKTNESKD